jgi:hypothetical protein
MFADDAAAGRANHVSYKKNIHLRRLARRAGVSQRERVALRILGMQIERRKHCDSARR